MRRIRDSHAQWRELIATRLDRPLTRSESRYLNTHLKGCEACRSVEHDYREQRKLLRALPPRIPPRDLWARTSGALDREVARGAYRGRGFSTGRRNSPSAALLTTLATVGVVAALAVMQVMPATQIAPPSAAGKATPFAVNPQSLAFIGSQASDVYLIQVDVAHACPQTEPECSITEGFVRNAVNLPAKLRARNAAIDPSGKNLAFVGRALGRDLIGVLVLPPGSDGSGVPTATDGSANPPQTPATTGEPTETTSPETALPETPGPETPGPDQTPTDQTPLPEATASAPPPDAVAGLTVLAILEDVQSAGAPPDWSAGGEMLAFSAMPADGSTGPDVYVWAPNDEHARAITTDHNSYFASWSGDRIVASRLATAEDGSVATRTVVIDPLTLEERRVTGPRMWLPVVNPAGTRAIAWRGEMSVANGLAVPLNGTLYMVDWTQLDPFAPGNEAAPPPEATDAPTPEPTIDPAATTAPVETSDPAGVEPKSESQASATPAAEPTTAPEPTTSPEPNEPNEPAVSPPSDLVQPLDPNRDPATDPILDWQARWSTDGRVLGVWTAGAAGETWGSLTVYAIDLETGTVNTDEPLLPPTLARRGFSLGESRVAWVAPPDATEGELRIATWGPDGVGGLRLQPAELQEVVPAF